MTVMVPSTIMVPSAVPSQTITKDIEQPKVILKWNEVLSEEYGCSFVRKLITIPIDQVLNRIFLLVI